MKLVQYAFLVSLFCFLILGSVILALKTSTTAPPKVTTVTTTSQLIVTNSPTIGSNQCIVTVDGTKYDVTSFRNQHSGGDVFQCGTDMSAVFHGQHSDRYLSMMQRYKI